ncbi:fasciclin domain-containing protein [Jannaschia ovalis]
MKTRIAAALAALAMLSAQAGSAQEALPIVGGAPMSPEKTIVGNAVNSADHEVLVAAVEAAGLVPTLSSRGPYTVFAPTDAAFGRISDASLAALMRPENRGQLGRVLTCHVVAADVMTQAMTRLIAAGGGQARLSTMGGCELRAEIGADGLVLTDENGRAGRITIADVRQLNGVIHVIDRVMLPAS